MFPAGTVGGKKRERERDWGGGGVGGGGGGGLVLESMAAGATALLTWFVSSRLIPPLLVRSRLCGRAARQGTFNLEIVCVPTRSGELWFTACLLLLVVVILRGKSGRAAAGSAGAEAAGLSLVLGFLLIHTEKGGGQIPRWGSAAARGLCLYFLYICIVKHLLTDLQSFSVRTQRCLLAGKLNASWRKCSRSCVNRRLFVAETEILWISTDCLLL